MLFKHPDHSGTLFIRSTENNSFSAQGDENISLGYSVGTDAESAEEGVWAYWDWDGSRLRVKNDRFGFLPIYYAHTPDGFGVSTSALSLIKQGVSAELDNAAIAVFLRLGYYVGDDTPFNAIKTLSPGTELVWKDGQLESRSHAPPIKTTISSLTRSEAVAAYGEIFQEAVEDMLPDPEEDMVVPLSAGRDSRHILYALLKAGRQPKHVLTTRSMAPRPDNDAQMAAKICQSLQLDHIILEQSSDRFEDEISKNLLTDFCSDEHAHMMPLARWVKDAGAPVSWDGIAGDIISCGFYNEESIGESFKNRDYASLCDWLLTDDHYLALLVGDDAMKVWSRELAVERLSGELRKYVHLPNPAAPFFFYNRVRRELALSPYALLNAESQVLAPYLSHKLFDLLIDLPFEYFKGREFHSEAIDQYYPEMPRFPYISVHTGQIPERRYRTIKYAKKFFSLGLKEKTGASVFKKHKLLPRLAKGMFDREYGTSIPDIFSKILVVMHLQQTMRRGT